MAEESFDVFEQAFAQVAQEWLDAATLTRRIETDGPWPRILPRRHRGHPARGSGPRGCRPPSKEEVQIVSQRLVGEAKNHLSAQARSSTGQPRGFQRPAIEMVS